MGATISCCAGSTVNLQGILQGINCCGKKKKKIKADIKSTVIFNKLPDDIDYSKILNNETVINGFNLVINSNGFIISAHSSYPSKMFGVNVEKLIGFNLIDDLDEFIPHGIISMVTEILNTVKSTGLTTGCLVSFGDRSEPEHILLGLPIGNNSNIMGVFLVKQQFTNELRNISVLSTISNNGALNSIKKARSRALSQPISPITKKLSTSSL